MPEKEFNAVFSKRLRSYLSRYEITRGELAEKLGVGTTSVYNWCNGIKTPRVDKVDAMCDLFGCKRSDLIEEKDEPDDSCYLNQEILKIAQEISENPELYSLFHVARDIPSEQLKAHIAFMKSLKTND